MSNKQKLINIGLLVLGIINMCLAWAAWSMSEPVPARVRAVEDIHRKTGEQVQALLQWVTSVAPIQHTHTMPTNTPTNEVTNGQAQ